MGEGKNKSKRERKEKRKKDHFNKLPHICYRFNIMYLNF